MYYVYVMQNVSSGKLYIGYCSNLKRRAKEHKMKKNVELVYYEAYLEEIKARDRERKLKMYGSAWRGVKKRLGFP